MDTSEGKYGGIKVWIRVKESMGELKYGGIKVREN